MKELLNINFIIGHSRFFRTEYALRKNEENNKLNENSHDRILKLINYFKNEILNNYEVLEIKYTRELENSKLFKDNYEKISNKYNFITSIMKIPENSNPIDELENNLTMDKVK